MRTIPDQLKSRNLVPFKKRHGRYKIPGLTSEHEVLIDPVDTDLSPEEQGFIRRYLGYADAFLRSVEHIMPEPLEPPVAPLKGPVTHEEVAAQNQTEEVTERPASQPANPANKAA